MRQQQHKQNQKQLAPIQNGANNNKNGGSYHGTSSAQGSVASQSAKIKEPVEQRRLLQNSREMKGKQSGVIAHEKLESDLIPPEIMTNSFSNTKYGQNFNVLA